MITGMGAVSAAGPDVASLWQAVVVGQSPAKWIVANDGVSQSQRIAACAVDDTWLREFPIKRYARMDRSVHLALNAGQQACRDAGLLLHDARTPTFGVVLGTSRGPIHATVESVTRLQSGKSLAPCTSAHTTIGCAAGAVAFCLGADGPCQTVSATCASGAHAIINAAQHILCGEADVMLAGGTDAPLHPAVIEQMAATGVLGSHENPALACRPFDRDRNGTVLGEGAAFVVLEELTHARRRGVQIHAQLAGWATGTDLHHETAPTPDGYALATVMQSALDRAHMTANAIHAINLHGTGTVMNDSTEAAAIHALFGEHAATIPSSSTKPVTGHCLGAAAALEAIISILGMKHGMVPPNAGLDHKGDGCDINLVEINAIELDLKCILSNSVGFWGNNASLVFSFVE